jgi:hypothetical protein
MSLDDEIVAGPEVSEEFAHFEEFCAENVGRELAYLQMVKSSPLDMDAVTLAFCLRHLVRLSDRLMDVVLRSLDSDPPPDFRTILALQGIQLSKSHAQDLRTIIFAFRDAPDEERRFPLVRALQLMTIGRHRSRVVLSLDESYSPPDEGLTLEDVGGDELALETVRTIEDESVSKFEEN